MIFLDSNVPMYLVGADHPHKFTVRRILERLVAGRERMVTDAEVIQEILHRYMAIRRPEAIRPCIDALLGLADEVVEIRAEDVLRARDLVTAPGGPSVGARDAVHIAVMERVGVRRVLSFDAGFDAFEWVERVWE